MKGKIDINKYEGGEFLQLILLIYIVVYIKNVLFSHILLYLTLDPK